MPNITEQGGRADVAILNIMQLHASAIGNHEFDAGPAQVGLDFHAGTQIHVEDKVLLNRSILQVANLLGTAVNRDLSAVTWFGLQFPTISATLDFTNNTDLAKFFTNETLPYTAFAADVESHNVTDVRNMKKLAASTT